MDSRFCNCKDCNKMKRREGKVLWHRLLRHFGEGAYYVSQYAMHPKYRSGRARKERWIVED